MWAHGLEDALSSDHQAQHKVSTTSTAAFSTRLNEQCKRGTTKKAHAVPKPMGAPPSLQSRSVCPDPSVGIRICSSKTHTPAWNCYKAHCLLSQTGFDRAALPVCEWLFVRRLSLFETCSLIPAHALCVLIPRACGRIGWVMGTRVNILFPILPLLNCWSVWVQTRGSNGAGALLVCMWFQASSQTHTCKQMNAHINCSAVWPQK